MVTDVNLRSSAFDVYIGRAGHGQTGEFGNPFIVGRDGARGECVEKFRTWFHSNDVAACKMRQLALDRIPANARLGCFCKPNACHGDVIAAFVNEAHALKSIGPR